MFSRLREHLGSAGLIVAVVALVVALAGGAIAATGGGDGKATASAKGKKGPRGPKGPKGPKGDTGPAGPAGPQGPAGAKGDAGAAGANGANGANGATGPTGAKGATGATGAAGANGVTGLAGAVGPTGPTGPSGGGGGGLPAVLTGVWSTGGDSSVPNQVPISFLTEVEPAPALVYVQESEGGGLVVDTSTGTLIEEADPTVIEQRCNSGTPAEPDAAPGNVCVFAEIEEGTGVAEFIALITEEEAPLWISPNPESGVVVPVSFGSGGYVNGSWAVNTE